MPTDKELSELLREFTKGPIQSIPGVVTNVVDAESQYIIDVKPIGGAPLLAVRLKASIDGNIKDGLVEIPEKDSAVLVGIINDDPDTAFLRKTSKVSKVLLNGVDLVAVLVEKFNQLEERMTLHQHLSATPGNPTTIEPTSNPDIIETKPSDFGA